MDRNTLLWTLVVFFGASIMFGVIGNALEDESAVLRVGVQALAGLLLVGLLVAYVRRQRQ